MNNHDQTGSGSPRVSEPIRVLVAEDNAAFRAVIRAVVGFEDDIDIIAEASDGEEAIALVSQHAPNVVLMDVRMPRLSGIEATRVLNEIHPNTKVLMLTISDEENDVFEAIKAGASGYLLKTSDTDELATAVRRLHNGQAVLSASMTAKVVSELASTVWDLDRSPSYPLLTNREVHVLRQLALGLENGAVARKLEITPAVVNTHLQNVLTKLHLHQRMLRRSDPDGAATRHEPVGHLKSA